MSFSIAFIDEKKLLLDGEPSARALIKIGAYKEELLASLLIWKIETYKSQWKQGLQRIETNSKTCLISAMRNIELGGIINRWLLYREGDLVHIQNEMMFHENCLKNPTIEELYNNIPDRVTTDPDGHKISEWTIESDLALKFANSM